MSALTSLMVLAQVTAEQLTRGRHQDDWGYVWASYGIAWGGLALYSLSLWVRRPKNLPAGPKE